MLFLRLQLLLTVSFLLLQGCQSSSYEVKNVAKSDIDFVADLHVQDINQLLEELLVKLYKRNPDQLSKSRVDTIEERHLQLFSDMSNIPVYVELDHKTSLDAMELAFNENFSGDRVFALMAGLVSMIRESYNYKEEFFIIDSLDEQKLYNSARNIEILVWKLSNTRNDSGRLMLLTNGYEGDIANLSFERLFGKLIAHQDMMAKVIATRTNRNITKVVQSVASAAFMPLSP